MITDLMIAIGVGIVVMGLVQLGFWLVDEPYWFLKDEDEP